MRLDLQTILKVYTHYVDMGDVDKANFFLASFTGFIGFIKYLKVEDERSLSDLIRSLRESIIEGPNYLNPYVMELLGILEEELSEDLFNEFLTKLRALLREERLDRLEV